MLLLAALLVVGVARIAATYGTYNHTYDEAAHIGAAMQYVDGGRYSYENKHPPMRAVFAVGPWLLGQRYAASPDMWQEGRHVLYDGGNYFRVLTAARIAALPFFLATVVLVFFWALRLARPWAASFAALAYSTLPLALAHAGLATNDTLLAATFTLALLAWTRFLQRPTRGRALWFGAAAGLAILSKLSAIPFLGAIVLVTAAGRYLRVPGLRAPQSEGRNPAVGLWAVAACALVIWAAYGFAVAQLTQLGPAHAIIDRDIAFQAVRSILRWIVDIPLPAPGFLVGVRDLAMHAIGGHPAFFMGEIRDHGHPAFFPVALLIKTPIPFLLLSAFGAIALVRRSARTDEPAALMPPLASLILLVVAIPGGIAIGLRHLLPIFPLLAICAGAGAAILWQWPGRLRLVSRGLVGVLLGWQVLAGLRAHPDYLPYFNECCADEPQRWLVDSDLDWGQDLERLGRELRARRVDRLHLAYFGSADPTRHGLPPFAKLPPHKSVRGWVAISEWEFAMGTRAPPNDHYAWLLGHRPVARVGKSIRLYRIE